MKKVFAKFLMLAVIAIIGASCKKSMGDDITPDSDGAVLYVSDISDVSDMSAESRVSIDVISGVGLTFNWEVDDILAVYKADGTKLDDFKCTAKAAGSSKAKFQSLKSDTKLEDKGTYTAIYPAFDELNLEGAKAAIDPSVQNGAVQSNNEILDFDSSLYVLSDFTYSGNSTEVAFEHQLAVFTLEFPCVGAKPGKLIFENGQDDVYTVNFTDFPESSTGVYLTHITVNPCQAVERDLIFTLYAQGATETDKPLYIRRVGSNIAFAAGMRYSAQVGEYPEDIRFSGSGTQSDPFQITTADDLHLLSRGVNAGESYDGKYFKMTNDINLGGSANEFTAIGASLDICFSGTFDGDGKTISGLYINKTDNSDYQGLFGYVSSAAIKNLSVAGSVTTGGNCVGGIVGAATFSTVTNCSSAVEVTASGQCAGGVMGMAESSAVVNCYNLSEIKGAGNVGGVVGYATDSYVTNSYSIGAVSGTDNVGGVVGDDDASELSRCYWASDAVATTGTHTTLGVGSDNTSTATIAGSVTKMTLGQMQEESYITRLNNGAYAYNKTTPDVEACAWVKSSDYPILDLTNTNPPFIQLDDVEEGTGF